MDSSTIAFAACTHDFAPNKPHPPQLANQPISPVAKLICQQQAKEFQAQYNTAAKNNFIYAGNIFGGGAFGLSYGSILTGLFLGYDMNVAQSNAAYAAAYDDCITGQYP